MYLNYIKLFIYNHRIYYLVDVIYTVYTHNIYIYLCLNNAIIDYIYLLYYYTYLYYVFNQWCYVRCASLLSNSCQFIIIFIK